MSLRLFVACVLRAHLQQHVGEVAVRELEVPLVVELEEGRAVGVLVLEVQVVDLRLLRRVAALLAHVDLRNRAEIFIFATNVIDSVIHN